MQTVKDEFRPFSCKTPGMSLAGKKMWARVVDVYDADTLTIVLPAFNGYYRFSGRVYGIDTSEIKSKVAENKASANRARNRVLQLLGVPNAALERVYSRKEVQAMLQEDVFLVWVVCGDFDKYGRLLITPYQVQDVQTAQPDEGGRVSIGDVLVREKLAYPYFGETKLTEAAQAALLE